MNYYTVGTIVATQGLQGEVRVYATTDFPKERFAKGVILALFDKTDKFVKELTVARAREAKDKLWICLFAGFSQINQVEGFRDFKLKVAEDQLSDLDEGEFYYHEIIGLDVYEGQTKIGVVSEILQPGANDVWVIKRPGQKDLLLPYIASAVLAVDLAGKRVDVEVPEGLDDDHAN